jgi:hypothetical protein
LEVAVPLSGVDLLYLEAAPELLAMVSQRLAFT